MRVRRYRRSPWFTGFAVALVVAMKLFVWPLLLWLLCARRFKAFSIGATIVFSQGVIVSVRASAIARLATWLSGTSEP